MKFFNYLLCSILLSQAAYAANQIVYSNPNYECMQTVEETKDKTLLITDHHNLVEGYFCPQTKTYTYLCQGDISLYCQLKNVPQNTIAFFKGKQISYTGGGDTVPFWAARIRYKAPFIFKSNTTSDVGFTNKCPEHAKMVEEKIIKLCETFTNGCKAIKNEHQDYTRENIYCRPQIIVKGSETRLY